MKWQEYQEAVAILYEQLDGFGNVKRNVFIPDKITGQNRQLDVLIELEERGHKLSIVVDAKFHATPLDVKDIEEVIALSSAVNANKTVIVALNGWTKPAEIKAQHLSCDLKILSLEEALGLLVPDKWFMCPSCNEDCVVLTEANGLVINGLISLFFIGKCRMCNEFYLYCDCCGIRYNIPFENTVKCYCGHTWSNTSKGFCVLPDEKENE